MPPFLLTNNNVRNSFYERFTIPNRGNKCEIIVIQFGFQNSKKYTHYYLEFLATAATQKGYKFSLIESQ